MYYVYYSNTAYLWRCSKLYWVVRRTCSSTNHTPVSWGQLQWTRKSLYGFTAEKWAQQLKHENDRTALSKLSWIHRGRCWCSEDERSMFILAGLSLISYWYQIMVFEFCLTFPDTAAHHITLGSRNEEYVLWSGESYHVYWFSYWVCGWYKSYK